MGVAAAAAVTTSQGDGSTNSSVLVAGETSRAPSTTHRSSQSAVSRSATRRSREKLDPEAIRELADERTKVLKRLQRRAESFEKFLEANQWVLPLASYDITATFGQASALWSTTHTGVDFAAPEGTTIRTVSAGTVTETGYAGPYGERTIVRADDGTEFWYCHQSSISVSPGQRVDPGQPIGEVGSTGNVTGPHLHFEVRPLGGDPVDPLSAMRGRGMTP